MSNLTHTFFRWVAKNHQPVKTLISGYWMFFSCRLLRPSWHAKVFWVQTKSAAITVGKRVLVMSFLGGRDQAETAGGIWRYLPQQVSLEKLFFFLILTFFCLFKKCTLSLGFFTLLPITFATTLVSIHFVDLWQLGKWRSGEEEVVSEATRSKQNWPFGDSCWWTRISV